MKALTVAQPWASLIVAGVKTIETRPMPPNGPMCPAGVRGLPGLAVEPGERIAIHASLIPPPKRWHHDLQGTPPPEVDHLYNHADRPDLWEHSENIDDPMGGPEVYEWSGPLGAIVGTAVVAEVLPIIDLEFGWQCDTDTPERALVTDGTHAELLGPGSAGDDVTEQLPLDDYRPGRFGWWAWVLTDPHRCQDRCPNPDCERGVIDLTQPHRGGPWQWQLCPVCAAPGGQVPGDGRCDPIPTRGAQGVWEWPLSRRSQPGEPAS